LIRAKHHFGGNQIEGSYPQNVSGCCVTS